MDIYIFTAGFPYGLGEPWLGDELPYLVKEFDKVTLIPFAHYGLLHAREVPEGVVFCEPLITKRTRYNLKGLLGGKTLLVFLKDFFIHGVFLSRKRMYAWGVEYMHTNLILHHPFVKKIKKEIKPDDVIYSYWGIDAYNLSVFWKGKAKFVSRFHGSYDLWEESRGNYAPLRSFVAPQLDLAAPISKIGYNFLTHKYPGIKAKVCRLGAYDCGVSSKSKDGLIRVLSCAYMNPLKRIPMIFQSLEKVTDIRIEWTHIGDGADRATIEAMVAANSNPNLTVKLLGSQSHEKVIDYYRNNPVDAFISLSAIEGIPVSIMEAISFDVPAIGTDVGGTKEIVNEKTGVLISSEPTYEEVEQAIRKIQTGCFAPRQYWLETFKAESNYAEFSKLLKTL